MKGVKRLRIKQETIEEGVKETLDDLWEEEIKEDYQIEIIARNIYAHLYQYISDQVRAEAYTLKKIMGRVNP